MEVEALFAKALPAGVYSDAKGIIVILKTVADIEAAKRRGRSDPRRQHGRPISCPARGCT